MREINGRDAMRCVRLVKACGLRGNIKAMYVLAKTKKDFNIEEAGLDIILGMLEECGDREDQVWEMLAAPMEMDPNVLAESSISAIKEKIKELISYQNQEVWQSFFEYVSDSMK